MTISKLVWALLGTVSVFSMAASANASLVTPTGTIGIGDSTTSLESGGLLAYPNGFYIGSSSDSLTTALGSLKSYFAANDTAGLASLANLLNSTSPVAGTGGTSVRIAAIGDQDPFINFAISASQAVADGPQNFTFVFTTPVSPLLHGLVSLHATLGITLSSPPASALPGGETIAPIVPETNIMFSNIGLGAGACQGHVDIGTGFGSPPSTSTTQSFSADGVLDLTAGGCDPGDFLAVEVSFLGSGHGSTYGLTGLFEVTQIPEPASVALLSMGVLGLFGVRRRWSMPSL